MGSPKAYQALIDVAMGPIHHGPWGRGDDGEKAGWRGVGWEMGMKVAVAFTISADVPEIFMQQFWTILDIYPRVEGVNFTDVPDDDTTLAFLIKMGYRSTETVDVSDESEPESVKRKTSSKRRVKKKVTLSAYDNIISDDPDTALELGKSISQTEAEEAEAARQVHATHARIVIEYVLEPTKRRKSSKVTFDLPKKLKGVPSLTPEEQEAADIMQALKESKKTTKYSQILRGLSGRTEKEIIEENVILEWVSEQESKYSEEDKLDDEEKDDKEGDVDDEDDETESDEDDIYKASYVSAKRQMPEKTSEYLLRILTDADINSVRSSHTSTRTPFKESPSIANVTTLPPPSVSTTPPVPQQTTTLIHTPPIITDAATITTAVSESDALSVVQLRVAKLEKYVSELKKINLSALKTQVPSVVDNYLRSKVGDVFKKELKKHTADLI
ncbi:hypothetical protein Tco_0015275 [Tanacetum coccineum]